MVENGRQWQRIDFRVFLVVVIEVTRKTMAEMAENGRKRVAAGKWQEMDFRVFHVVAIEVARQAMAENGRKWPKMVENGFPRENGRKWISACFPSFSYYYFNHTELVRRGNR